MKRQSIRLELEQLEDRLAPATFTVTATNDNGNDANPIAGSLRAAIVAVNKGQDNTIDFNVKGSILVNTNPLPTITKPVTIDGSTAPGGNIEIKPDPAAPPRKSNGLTFAAGSDGSQILGLTIDLFNHGLGISLDDVSFVLIGEKIDPATKQATFAPVVLNQDAEGLLIEGVNAKNNTVFDSFIGTDTNSKAGVGNKGAGIIISALASNNRIGGTGPNEMNIISGNTISGILIDDASNNIIAGNYIGMAKDGKTALPNNNGITIQDGSTGNQIGQGATVGANGVQTKPSNLISGNISDGVKIDGQNSTGNTIAGNWIGVDITGNAAPAKNNVIGVELVRTTGNTIGGMSRASLNIISGNGFAGIAVSGNQLNPSTDNKILNNNIGIGPNRDPKNLVAVPNGVGISFDANSRKNIVRANVISKNKNDAIPNKANNKFFDPNSIYDNGFGIDDGTQAGAPVLSSAVVSGNTLIVSGTLSSTPNTTFALEFFGGTDLDPTGSAEGQQWLGTYDVTTDSNGNASFQVTLNAIYGPYITATATDTSPDGGTSDFSNTITASGEGQNAAVGGNVWNDTDANGLLDNNESGVSNVTVQLFTSSGSLVASTTTDAYGNYLFTNVTPGDYYLQFTAPSGYAFTPPYQGDDTIDSHADPSTGDTEQFSLLAGEVDPYYNAGLIANSLSEPTTTALDTTENPSNYGYQVTFTATVTQTDSVPLSGNVTFTDGNTVLATVDLTSDSGGYQASFTTSALAVGNHTITATYNGDGFHSSSSASLTQSVLLPLSVTSLNSSANPALPGQSVTFTATVTGDGTPTGTVAFYDGSTELGTATLDSNGNATFTTSTLAAGTHNITADYSGDSNFASSSGSLTQLISQETSSTMSLSSSVNPSLEGQAVTFTATVSGNSGTPTGTVTFMDGYDTLGTATLDSTGTATLTTSALSLGSQTITAIYSGDGTYNSNSASLTQTVNSPVTLLSLSSNDNPAPSGDPVTFTVNVSPEESTLTPTGTVNFYDGTTELGTATLDANGNASFTTSSLVLGSHDIIAEYSGDSNFDGSSDSLMQVISQENSSSVSLSSSVNPATPNQAVTFTATVTGSSGTPTGTVTFLNGDTVLGVETLDSNGNATLTTSALSLSSQIITAVYSGDATYADSSTSLTQQVYQAGTSTSVSADNNPAQPGQAVTFTAVVSTTVSGTPTGTVTFLDGTTTLGTATLTQVNGQLQATFTTSTLTSGSHTITAVYSGDDTFMGSSGSMTETVGQSSSSPSAVSLSSSASPSPPGQSVTFTATVYGNGGTPTGTVTFLDGATVLGTATLDANGNASFTTASLGLGYHDIIAVYSGDNTFASSAASLSQLIDLVPTYTSLSSSANPSPSGQAVTFTATVSPEGPSTLTPTGTVAFYDGTTFLGTGTLTLVNGQWQAMFTTAALGLGTHDIIAIYSGDGSFADSESSLTETISS